MLGAEILAIPDPLPTVTQILACSARALPFVCLRAHFSAEVAPVREFAQKIRTFGGRLVAPGILVKFLLAPSFCEKLDFWLSAARCTASFRRAILHMWKCYRCLAPFPRSE